MRELLIIALVLACPLMMVLMMRGGHGHGGHAQARGDESGEGEISREPNSIAELRRRRDELDRLIEERESQVETPTPIGGGRR
jgi:Protein of unknown function (DUF2933)